ncbi:MAG TPA: glycoside hydrolase family 3 C-terminal domain-containing protein [Clostridia bacterium]|nr:glycoside hydrolase family 3 C-terminal domain-containing protein [Clostridia bacterium]
MKFKDSSLPPQERIEDLISRLDVEEKVSQLCNASPAITALGIPEYNWWNEALHGVARAGTATVFPQAIAMAAAFNEHLVYEIAAAIAEEARAKYNVAQKKSEYEIYQGLTFWSPNVNIFRDPRWGRGHETYGEDPYLTGTLGVAFIKGLQHSDGKHMKAAACAKHFAVHSGPEGCRHSFDSKVSKKDLYETYLPAFEMCVKDGKVEAVMGAYNGINGSPCCANRELLTEILRNRWGFEGHVVSDCGAIRDISVGHEVTQSFEESSALALKAGCDLCCGDEYLALLDAYESDLITEDDLDTALRRLFNTRFKLGMFDKAEEVSYSEISEEQIASAEHKELSLEAARQSIVLLKNDGLLPLDAQKLGKIAVIGPNADSVDVLLGNYNGTPTDTYTILGGMASYLGKERVAYAKGCELFVAQGTPASAAQTLLKEALAVAKDCDTILACVGLDPSLEGEEGDAYNAFASGDKPDLALPVVQQELLEALKRTGKPLIVAINCGSALTVNWAQENANAVLDAWYPGEMGGLAFAQLVFGDYSPSGRLPITFYQTSEELPDFSDYSMDGRTYRYMTTEPLYPFGYGLSYTRFEYSAIKANATDFNETNIVQLCFQLKNAGEFDGFEKIQIYIEPLNPSVKTPPWQLKTFKAVYLKKGEQTEVLINLPASAFSIVDNDGECFVEQGNYRIYVGGNQPDKRSEALTGAVCGFADVVI